MSPAAHTRSPRALSFAQWVGALAFCASTSVLVGWQFGISSLTSVLPAWPQMVALSALAFTLAAASLWLQARVFAAGETLTDRRSRASRACAVLVAIIGLASLIAWVLGWNLRLGNLESLRTSADVAAMDGMSAATGLAFVLLGGALLLARSSRFARMFQACAILTLLMGWLGFSHYVYGGEPLTPYAAMAIHASAMFLMLGAGVLSLRSDIGLMALFASDAAGGLSIRRLLPAAVFVPLLAGALTLYADRNGWFGTHAALSLFAFTSVIVFAALVWINAAMLDRADLQRQRAQRALSASEERTRLIIETALDAVITMASADRERIVVYLDRTPEERQVQIQRPSRKNCAGQHGCTDSLLLRTRIEPLRGCLALPVHSSPRVRTGNPGHHGIHVFVLRRPIKKRLRSFFYAFCMRGTAQLPVEATALSARALALRSRSSTRVSRTPRGRLLRTSRAQGSSRVD